MISDMFYPRLCRSCDKRPPVKDRLFCTHCLYKLPYTSFENPEDNLFTQHFWGRIPIVYGLSLFYYVRNGPVPSMIKQLKYNGQSKLGKALGAELGLFMKGTELKEEIDIIVPVPIHPRKKRTRGYNQAQMIAEGLAKELNIAIDKECLVRTNFNASQTKKTRNERVKDLAKSFALSSDSISNKHILLVDDVLTTGATLEACGTELLKAENVKLSLATLAQGFPN